MELEEKMETRTELFRNRLQELEGRIKMDESVGIVLAGIVAGLVVSLLWRRT